MSKDTNTIVKKSTQDSIHPPSVGSIVEGKIVARERSALFLDLGFWGTGIIYGREFYEAKDIIKNLKIGDTIYAKIIDLENDDGYRELSLKDAAKEINLKKLQEMKDNQEIIKVKISGVNKGGLLTSVNNIAAFLPVSQLSPENYPRVEDADKTKILKELQKFVGKTMEVKVLDLLPQENKLILSEKAKNEQLIKKIISQYKKGDIIQGKITGIADFGVFIRFPITEKDSNQDKETSIEGLCHISELDWQLVQDPAQLVKVGEIIKAQIIDISDNQIFLSLKSLKDNPWDNLQKKHKKGDVIKGKVIAFSPFGAFVEVLPKIRGLCHISEFSSQMEMEKLLKIGQSYSFEILLIESKEHRMSLKLVNNK